MTWCWGAPKNQGEMNFRVANIMSKDRAQSWWTWIVHPIRNWYGVTIGDRLFIGIISFDKRRSRQTEGCNHGNGGDHG